MIHVGVCGFPASRASLYAQLDVVEIQKSFYAPLSEKQLLRFRKEAPSHFIFTMKAFQGVTHPHTSPTYRRGKLPPHFVPENLGFFRPTPEVRESAEITLHEARIVQAKVIVIQCPPSFRPIPQNLDYLYHFFQELERDHFLWGFEPRGSWPTEVIQKICQDLHLIYIVDPFLAFPTTDTIQYFRLHGKGGYHYRYTREEIQILAQKLKTSPQETFCLFNNTFMLENALELKRALTEA
ncbi:MAG: DUF72 domain-containing protein [Candidatus Caldatribacteriaceae bacterium]